MSELRQQLRKRGLPVSGTKPTLLQRLRPFQIPHSCLTPAPLCQLGTSLEPLTPTALLPSSQSPGSSSSSGLDSPSSSPNQQMYIPDRGVPNGILSDAQNGILNNMPNGFSNASVSLVGEQCLSNAVFMAPASTASGTPSPSLPMSSSSPLQCGTPWRNENDQQQQQQQELSVELEMRERLRSRPRDRTTSSGNEVRRDRLGSLLYDEMQNDSKTAFPESFMFFMYHLLQSCGGSLHPFLQQDPGCSRGKPETDAQTEVLFTQVNMQINTHTSWIITFQGHTTQPSICKTGQTCEQTPSCQLIYPCFLIRCFAANRVM